MGGGPLEPSLLSADDDDAIGDPPIVGVAPRRQQKYIVTDSKP